MGNRISRIYTRTGDDGSTGLADGRRVPKDDALIECIGTVDELNSVLGMALAEPLPAELTALIGEIQHRLFDLGGELSLPGYEGIRADDVTGLEQAIDRLNSTVPPLKEFILPAGAKGAAHCHLARAVCRRAERHLVSLARQQTLRPEALHFINRLSDFLFVAARVAARSGAGQEIYWQQR